MTSFTKRLDVRISVIYGVIATLWALLSDLTALLLFGNNHPLEALINIFKGLGFVVVTTLALFFVLSAELRKRNQTEKVFRENEYSLKRAQAIAHLGNWTWNIQTNILRWSDEMYHIFGLDCASVTGNLNEIIEAAVHPDDKAMFIQANKAVLTNQKLGVLEYRIIWPDGSVHYLWGEGDEKITDAEGKTVRLSGIVQDVTTLKASERALLDSETRYRTLIEQASDGIFIANSEGRYIEVNSAGCQLLGYSREELLQKTMGELIKAAPDAPIRFAELRAGKILLSERQLIRKDGTLVAVEISSKQLSDGSFQGIARDITQRKVMEQELRLKSAALEAAANGIVITNIDGLIEWVNPAFAALTGYNADEAEGHNPRELVRSGQHNQHFYEEMWNTILSGQVWHGEVVNRRKNGSLYTEEQTITPVRNESGEIKHFIAIKQDITERKLSEAAILRLNTDLEARVAERTMQLNDIKNRIESILNSTADAIIYSRVDGTIEQVNPAFSQIFGYQADEIVLKSLTKLVVPDDIPLLENAFSSIGINKKALQVDVTAYRKDGRTFDASVMLAPVIENGDPMVGIVSSIHDISSRNQMLHHAMSLSELKSRYVSMAAHDLRNPMAVILTSSETLEHYYDRLTEDKRHNKFGQIKASIKIMTDILDDVLIMGQADSGKLEFHPAPLDIKVFCQTMIAEMIQATGATVRVDFSVEQIGSTVMDAKLLRHIFGNLLSNAIKYSQTDSTVLCTITRQSDDLFFCVQDHGIGIPKADQERLFETFHRASNARNVHGTGLGLAIVKQSVELHGGTITFESEEGQGTTFMVTLPAVS